MTAFCTIEEQTLCLLVNFLSVLATEDSVVVQFLLPDVNFILRRESLVERARSFRHFKGSLSNYCLNKANKFFQGSQRIKSKLHKTE
uniref:Uncharacterized protein n=1 Tax=Anguilla anguilla TaxID=7936 RepID=A0A0E9TAU8_ANGAN